MLIKESHTYMRWVESGVQSGLYLAPISKAFSLSSPLKGFWKPLRTNTTPSMSRLNGTCSTPFDLVFCCLGVVSDFGTLSFFFSVDFCAGDAKRKGMESWPCMLLVKSVLCFFFYCTLYSSYGFFIPLTVWTNAPIVVSNAIHQSNHSCLYPRDATLIK